MLPQSSLLKLNLALNGIGPGEAIPLAKEIGASRLQVLDLSGNSQAGPLRTNYKTARLQEGEQARMAAFRGKNVQKCTVRHFLT